MSDTLTEADHALLDRARATCRETYAPDRLGDGAHVVTSALRTAGGVYEGVSLPASIGRASTCAEPGAVSAAVADGADPEAFETVVAVAHSQSDGGDDPTVIPPCGVCRELLVDYRADLRVIHPEDEEGGPLTVSPAESLLPGRTW